jgi:uncharacterized damage-inducible protein DinB
VSVLLATTALRSDVPPVFDRKPRPSALDRHEAATTSSRHDWHCDTVRAMADDAVLPLPETDGPPSRLDPAYTLGERAMLEAWLDFHRETLRWKLDGLDAEQIKQRSVPPSTMSLLGLVRHMADVERNWFRRVLAGEDAPGLFWNDEYPDGDFDLVDDAVAVDDVSTWQSEIDASRALAANRSLDDAGMRRGQLCSLRWIYVHMIEEYARHNGHADLLRERIDGATGD